MVLFLYMGLFGENLMAVVDIGRLRSRLSINVASASEGYDSLVASAPDVTG